MDCVNLSVIPQFGGTCWFNAILMIALYSQETRKVLIKSSKTWDTNNKFLMILKAVAVKYYKNPDKVQGLFNKIKPELILFKMIKTYNDTNLINIFKDNFKEKINKLGWYENYITKFFRYLNLKCIDITYYNGYYLLNFDKIMSNVKIDDKYKYELNRNNLDCDKLLQETRKDLEEIPDIIVLFHNQMTNILVQNYIHNFSTLSPKEQAVFNVAFNNYKFKVKV